MKYLTTIIAASLALDLFSGSRANASDLTEGEELYTAQCKLCHGSLKMETGFRAPLFASQGVQVAVLEALNNVATDTVTSLIPAFATAVQSSPGARVSAAQWRGETMGERIAFAPPFGPNLRGIIGRAAGSVEGYTYSDTMMKTLKGMEWTEAALDVWITNPQAWVPGVYMYYKQKDPEIRRKIILYLKANP
jgi:cytochrome c